MPATKLLPTLLALSLFTIPTPTPAQQPQPLTRLAELQIDPAQLAPYKAALKEEIEASIRLEPGVLTLYAVARKDDPPHIIIFEPYASTAAYNSHLQAPHFKKYKAATHSMVRSLTLIETDPILLAAKPGDLPH